MPERILVVDDTPTNIEIVHAILKEKGYSISIATNGRQALQVMERVRPDLVLLDIMMPEMDGFETCRRIKACPKNKDVPIIFLTARTRTEDIVEGFELGAVDYVAKPFNAHELIARVQTHLALAHLHRENQRLLLNVLPARIAEKLKRQVGHLAERFDDVSVMFADIVNFTPLAARCSPTEVMELLNRVFSGFDELSAKHGLEKIKTIGDAYMVAGGLIAPDPNHLDSMAAMALEMNRYIEELSNEFQGLGLRIGLHTGCVVAGVIGRHKFSYDVWGDTVNTASRLESHGVPGRVHVSQAVFERLGGKFAFEPRGEIELKGRGACHTFFLESLS